MWIARLFAPLLAASSLLGAVAVQAQRPAISLAAEPQAIPFELFRGNRIFLSGRVNGREVSMLLDSGASSSVIDRQAAQRLGLPEGRRTTTQGAGGRVESRVVEGVMLSAGPLTIRDASVLVIDLSEISRRIGRPIDAILGLEAFRAGIVDIDFAAGTIRFASAQGFAPPAGAARLPLTDRDGRRTIPVSINGGPSIQADLDLGSNGTLVVSRDYWAGRSGLAELRFAPVLGGGVGGRVPKRLVTLPSVTLAGVTFTGVPAVLNEGASDLPVTGANVGLELLQRFRAVFDYRGGALYLLPDRAAIARPLAKNRHGLGLELTGGRLRVSDVVAGSPAAAAGWRVGDEVIAVNGIAVDARFYDRSDSRFGAMPAGTRLDLVRADGATLPVVLEDYF